MPAMPERKRSQQRRRQVPEKERKPEAKKQSGLRSVPGCEAFRDELLEAVSTPTPAEQATGKYKLLMSLAIIMLLVTPTAYLFLTLGGAIAWLAHLLFHANLLGGGLWGIVFYVVPAITGPFVIAFLVWPLFMKTAPVRLPRKIKREAEPFLYEYVDTLCDSLGAPRPAEIRLNCDVNAYASFSGGAWGMFSNRLTLTIGLPLVYGLSLPQLTGVLSHEFGHFSQRSGMRFSYLIRVLTNAVSNAAFGADPIRDWLRERRMSSGALGQCFWFGVSIGAWIARALMTWLALATNTLSSALVRQMEFDADRVEARVVGPDVFVESQKRIPRLAIAEQFALNDLETFYSEGRLVDDFPRLIATNIDQIDKKIDKAVAKMQKEKQTRLFDSHPSDRERIQNARRIRTKPAFHVPDKLLRARASILFRNIGLVSRGASYEFYRQALGPKLKKEELHPFEEMLKRRADEIEASKALTRFFRVEIPAMFPIPISSEALRPARDIDRVTKQLKHDRREMQQELKRYRTLVDAYENAEDCQMNASAAVSMMSIGVAVKGKSFNLQSSQRYDVEQTLNLAETAVGNISGKMLPFESAAGSRLSSALRLFAYDRFRAGMPKGDQEAGIGPLIEAAVATAELMGHLRPIRLICHRVVVVFSHIEGNEQNYDFIQTLLSLVESLQNSLHDLYWEMGGHDYPFDHATKYATIQTYVLPELPDKQDISGMLYAAQQAFSRLATLQLRVFAHLTQAAERVEVHLGLDPIPDPEEKRAKKKRTAR